MSTVRSLAGVPKLSDFKGTDGTPLILDLLTGDLYYLDLDNVTINKISSGGGGSSNSYFPGGW